MSKFKLKKIEVVAAVIESSSKILCVQRKISTLKYISEKWEFPGGKIEPGENHATALSREISEELQVKVNVKERLMTINHQYPDFLVIMHAYYCDLLNVESAVILKVHQNLVWLSPFDLDFLNLDWAEADIPIVQALHKKA